jgi:hypothetical protein
VADPRPVVDRELAFTEALVLNDAGEVALEDYARVLTRATRAEAIRTQAAGTRVTGVRLEGPSSPPSRAEHQDIEDFARGLASEGSGAGLGWT